MENSTTSRQWYDKTWLVIVLCILFFPVGLYALWKSSVIPKNWKICITIFILFIAVMIYSDKDKTPVTKVEETASQPKEEPDTSNQIHISDSQNNFITQKLELYISNYKKATNDAQKALYTSESKMLTKKLLDESNYTINDWKVKVKGVMLSDKPSDDALLRKGMTPDQIKKKDPNGRKIDFLLSNIVDDGNGNTFVISYSPDKSNMINTNNPIYNQLIGLSEGSDILISGKILKTEEYASDIESGILLVIKLTEIKPIN